MARQKETVLVVSESYQHPDAYIASGFLSPDPFILLQVGKKREMFISPFEVPRAKKESDVDSVRDLYELGYKRHAREQPDTWSTLGACAAELLENKQVNSVKVPADFPMAVGDFLQKHGVGVSVDTGFFESRRLIKDEWDIIVIN